MFDEGLGVLDLFLRLALADAVPVGRWNIHRPAQSKPDVSGIDARPDRLFSCQAANLTQYEVVGEDAPVRLAEFIGDGTPELTQPHELDLSEHNECPDRIGQGIRRKKLSEARNYREFNETRGLHRTLQPGRPEACPGWG